MGNDRHHPPDETLRAFVAEALAPQRERGVAAHLAVCDACCERCLALPGGRALLEEIFGAADLVPQGEPLEPGEVAQVLLSRSCLAELEASDPHDWALIAEHDPRFAPLPIVAALLDRAEHEYHRDLECAAEASAAAVAALERWHLSSDASSPKATALAARSWAVRGNVLRLQSRFHEADVAISTAVRWLAKSPGQPRLHAPARPRAARAVCGAGRHRGWRR